MPPVTSSRAPFPSLALGAGFLLLAGLFWPRNLVHLMPLDWRAGNLRPAAYTLAALFVLLGAACLVARESVNRRVAAVLGSRRFRFALVAMLLSLALGLALVEIALRILDLPFKPTWSASETGLSQFDPELGWSYLPNQTVVQPFGTARREVPMHFSALASRSRVPGVVYDPAAPSVLFAGCSVTMGHGVPYEETFEGQLEARPGFPLQVVNLGVQGYGTDQALLLLKRQMPRLNTKVVVYTYLDLHVERNENYDRRLLIPSGRFPGTKPLFGLDRDGRLYLRKKPARYEDMVDLRVQSVLGLFLTHWGPRLRLDLTRALLREMADYVAAKGATFLVVHWKLSPRTSAGNEMLAGLGVPVIDLANGMPPQFGEWRIPGDGHPDVRAHAHVAGLLAAELARLGWPAHEPAERTAGP
jgi:hypothetical protein